MEYVIYTREESGILSRSGEVVDSDVREIDLGEMAEEKLTGWPERTIYWASATGATIGYAIKRGQ